MINVEYAEPSVFPVLESIRLITNEVSSPGRKTVISLLFCPTSPVYSDPFMSKIHQGMSVFSQS